MKRKMERFVVKLPDEYHIQYYNCELGNTATIIIPQDATKEDLLAIEGMLHTALKTKYKLNI